MFCFVDDNKIMYGIIYVWVVHWVVSLYIIYVWVVHWVVSLYIIYVWVVHQVVSLVINFFHSPFNRIGGVMVSVFVLSGIDRGFVDIVKFSWQ